MIYIVWERGDTLNPSLSAYTNLKDLKHKLNLCKRIQEEDEGGFYDFGFWKVPNGKTKSEMCANITNHCF